MSVSTLVVIYGKQIVESNTLLSLSKIGRGKLLIFNNGPTNISTDCDTYNELLSRFDDVLIIQDITNKPLSNIYNKFLSDYHEGSDCFFIFDDDTNIPKEFFDLSKKNSKDFDLILPKVFDGGVCFYPKENHQVISKDYKFHSPYNILSIGSGLLISSNFLDVFYINNITPFDSRFVLYGVDFSFFKRINKYFSSSPEIKVFCEGHITHSLSKNSPDFEEWRHIERLYDVVLMAKYYSKSPLRRYFYLFKIILNELKGGRFKYLNIIFKTFVKGRHPRSL